MMRTCLAVCLIAAIPLIVCARPRINSDDRAYLRSLADDTWQSIAYMADGPGALPEDNTRRKGYTSVSNIGFYLASIPAAERLELIDHGEALSRISRVIEACEKLPTWEGFPHSWLRTEELGPTDEYIVSSVDLGNYEAGLIVCRQAYPELSGRISTLIDAMNWQALYCEKNGWLYGGWNTKDGEYTDWYYDWLAADSRTASFLAIAHGVPATNWDNLKRPLGEGTGPAHYGPGWMGGGLFTQTMTALFIDEAGTPCGRSAANFAWAQILRARERQLPAWGWSACATPDGNGYIGYGRFREEVVTPHATALAMLYFPVEAVQNFRALETLGARLPMPVDGQQRTWGFRDCVDTITGQTPDHMLILDQTMLFLACANVLADDCVVNWFAGDELCKTGKQGIAHYQVAGDAVSNFWESVEATRRGQVAAIGIE